MSNIRQIPVFGREGRLGWIEPAAAGSDADSDDVLVRLENGALIQVPADLLVQQADGSYYLPMSASQFDQPAGMQAESESQRLMVIPVMVEETQVSKRRTTRRVRVHKSVSQHEEVVDQPGFQDEVRVERVLVNKMVQSAPKARQEGETLVIPVLEEVLVVEKRLVLKEEVRITRQRRTTHNPQRVTLRSEAVQVERLEPEEAPTLHPAQPGETEDTPGGKV